MAPGPRTTTNSAGSTHRIVGKRILTGICIAVRSARWRRRGLDDRKVLGRYFVIAGLFRFALEFLRVNTRVVGPLTVAHIFSALVAILGIAILIAPRAHSESSARIRA